MKYEGFDVFSMGTLLRAKVEQNQSDLLWQKVGKSMDEGKMIPDVSGSKKFYLTQNKIHNCRSLN